MALTSETDSRRARPLPALSQYKSQKGRKGACPQDQGFHLVPSDGQVSGDGGLIALQSRQRLAGGLQGAAGLTLQGPPPFQDRLRAGVRPLRSRLNSGHPDHGAVHLTDEILNQPIAVVIPLHVFADAMVLVLEQSPSQRRRGSRFGSVENGFHAGDVLEEPRVGIHAAVEQMRQPHQPGAPDYENHAGGQHRQGPAPEFSSHTHFESSKPIAHDLDFGRPSYRRFVTR